MKVYILDIVESDGTHLMVHVSSSWKKVEEFIKGRHSTSDDGDHWYVSEETVDEPHIIKSMGEDRAYALDGRLFWSSSWA